MSACSSLHVAQVLRFQTSRVRELAGERISDR
jgi:hypothetical protein